MSQGLRASIGRGMAAAAVFVATSAMLVLVVGRRSDLILGEWAPQMAVPAIGFGILGWLAIPRQPDNRAVWTTTIGALLTAAATGGWALVALPGIQTASSPAEIPSLMAAMVLSVDAAGWPGLFLILTRGLLLFPDGKLASPRWRWVERLSLVSIVMVGAILTWTFRPSSTTRYDTVTFTGIAALLDPLIFFLIILTGFSVASLLIRYRSSTGTIRQQCRWILLGGTLLFVASAAIGIAELVPGIDAAAWERVVMFAGIASLVASYGVAVTRYRLYDIDVIISRTVVFGALAAFIGFVYVGVVVGVGTLVGRGADELGLSVLATALVAIAFEPVRRRSQAWANKLVFGRRSTPYQVLSDLAHRLASADSPEVVLRRMARLMAEGTGAEQANVWLVDRARLSPGAGWPAAPDARPADSIEDLRGSVYPVTHEGQLVGALQVTKTRGNPVTPTEQRLLSDLARSAGLVMGNQILNAALAERAEELRASRRRLVEAQDTERRRLERDLHDGAQQNVVALKVQVRLAEQAARATGTDQVADLLSDIAEDAQVAVEEIRLLARGIYPPLLESEGLEPALRSQAAAFPLGVEIDTRLNGRLPKETEAAIYFAVTEAISNAVKHGSPAHIRVELRQSDGELVAEIHDDGSGFDTNQPSQGMGLVNMRDRIEALGGTIQIKSQAETGTTVTARVPERSH